MTYVTKAAIEARYPGWLALAGPINETTKAILEVMTSSDHAKRHCFERKHDLVEFTCKCGNKVNIKQHVHRLRLARNKSGGIYCSRSCGRLFSRNNHDGASS